MNYIRIEEVIDFHDLLIEKYGGLKGIRDFGLLTSALAMPQQSFSGKDLHRSIYEKAAAYMYHMIKNHPFTDGNKRTGVFVCLVFLQRNGLSHNYPEDLLEKLAIEIATNKVDKTELSIILEKFHSKSSIF